MTILVLQPNLASADVSVIQTAHDCEAIWKVNGIASNLDMTPGIIVSSHISPFTPLKLTKRIDGMKEDDGFPARWDANGVSVYFDHAPYRIERLK